MDVNCYFDMSTLIFTDYDDASPAAHIKRDIKGSPQIPNVQFRGYKSFGSAHEFIGLSAENYRITSG
jgi:hypothetical protein